MEQTIGADGPPASDVAPEEPDAAPARRFLTVRLARLAGIVVPLAAVAWVAATRPLSFDGAMNLQVALSLVTEGSYSRYYGGEILFPSEIQTSSYYLFVSALGIGLFGPGNLGFQAGGLVFLAGLLTALSFALPRHRVLLAVGPGLLLTMTPGLMHYSVGGYGEGAVAGLAVGALVLLAGAVSAREPVRRVVAAFVLVGVAVSVKTVAVAVVPVALVALVVVLRAHGRPLRTLVLAAVGAAIPFALFEGYRLWTLGAVGYRDWWAYHLGRVNLQATGAGLEEDVDRVAKIADHFHLLSVQTGVAAEWWLALLLVLPLLAAGTLLLLRRVDDPAMRRVWLTGTYVLGHGVLYAAWWLAVTSTEKAWLRRITIGLLALLLAAVLLTWVTARLALTRTGPVGLRLAATALAAVTVMGLGVVAAETLPRAARWLTQSPGPTELASLARSVAELDEQGAELFGLGWWSAPVVSLYSGVELENLGQAPICRSPLRELIEDGNAYLVWDHYAEGLRSTEPTFRGVTFVETDHATDYGSLWRVVLLDDTC